MATFPYDERIHGDLERARAILPKKPQTKNAKQVLPGRQNKVPGKADTGALFGLSGITDQAAGVVKGIKGAGQQYTSMVDSAFANKRSSMEDIGSGARTVVDAAKEVPGLAYKAVDSVYTPVKDAVSYGMSNFMEGFRGGEAPPPPVSVKPKTPGQVNYTGRDTAVPSEASAAKVLDQGQSGAMGGLSFGSKGTPEPRSIVTPSGEVKTVPGLEPGLLPQPSEDIGPIDIIRGTQKASVNPTGIPHGGAPGLDSEAPLYTEFIGENTPEGRAKAEAASIRRNVFSTPGESEAMALEKRRGADTAARDYLRTNMEGATDKAKLAAERELGLATLGVRKQEIAGRENVANINAKGGVTNYKDMLEEATSYDKIQYFNELKRISQLPEEERQARYDAMKEANPNNWDEFMGQDY